MTDRLKQIGERIRRLRKAAEMTQSELAERSDLTAGFISQLERGKVSISIDSLLMILDALNLHISEFFNDKQERVVFQSADAMSLEREGVSEFLALVPGAANRNMEPVRVRLAPGEETTLETFSGEQYGYVLSGNITVKYGEKINKASRGQSFYAGGEHVMQISNKSSRDAVFLWISSPPYF